MGKPDRTLPVTTEPDATLTHDWHRVRGSHTKKYIDCYRITIVTAGPRNTGGDTVVSNNKK